MPYHLRCIIPHDRYCHFEGLRLVPSAVDEADEEIMEQQRLQERKVLFVGRDGSERLLSLLEISNELRFAYATHLAFMSERDLAIMPATWGLPHFTDDTQTAISPTALELGIVDQLENGELNRGLALKFVSEELGYGVFATETLGADTCLGEYSGIVLFTQNPGSYSLVYPCLDGGHEVNAADTGNLMRFVNHSALPNASFQRVFHNNIIHTVVRTTKSIFSEEQITVDYSPSYWAVRGVTPVDI